MIQTFLCRVHDCRLYILSWNLSGWLRRLWLFSFWFLPFWELSSFDFSEWFNRDWKMSCCAWSHVWIIRRRGSVLSTKNVRSTRDWAIVSITARGNNKTTRWWSSEMKKKKKRKDWRFEMCRQHHRRPKLTTGTRTRLLLASGVVLQTVIYKGLYGM